MLTRIDDAIAQLQEIKKQHGNLAVGAYWHDELSADCLRFVVSEPKEDILHNEHEFDSEALVVTPTWV